MREAVDSNTVCLIGSCPEFSYGNFDPLEEIGKIALQRGIGMHSDCCLGGFINPFLAEAGFKEATLFDFRNLAVTSISCDTHKYGYGPKGSSVLMFRH